MSTRALKRVRRRLEVSRYFGCPATLVRVMGDFDPNTGAPVETETETAIRCATAPATGDDARVRVLTEGGVQLDSMRRFWTVEPVEPVVEDGGPGDVLIYDGERYRARVVDRWGPGAFEVLAVRQEGQ